MCKHIITLLLKKNENLTPLKDEKQLYHLI